MANIIDYVTWRSDLTFNKNHFNKLDALIFTQLIYLELTDFVPDYCNDEVRRLEDVLDEYFKGKSIDKMSVGLILPKEILILANMIKNTKRYKNVYMSNHINLIDKEKKCQFSAVCFHINENDIVITFSGTDDTLIGWQENLQMLNTFPIPSQKLAQEYVNNISSLYPNSNIYITGHSKGGNLAAFSAIYCKDVYKEKIKGVYCFDSPGFRKVTINTAKYELIKDKIVNIMPKSAIIGLIFTPFAGKTIVCDSKIKGLRQHDAFSWLIERTKFIKVDDVTDNAKRFDASIKTMLNNLTEEQTNELANNIYSFILELNKNTLVEVQKDYIRFVKLLNKITPYNRKLFMSLVMNLIKYKLL